MTEDRRYYLVVTADASEEQARAAYVKRYNTDPERVYRMYPGREWWVGPVPEDEQWMTQSQP